MYNCAPPLYVFSEVMAILKDAMLQEMDTLKAKILTSLFSKERVAVALKKEVLDKSTTIQGLEQVNEKQRRQISKMKSLIQPLKDTVEDQGVEMTKSRKEFDEIRARVKALELKVKQGEKRADSLSRKLEEKTRECLKLVERKECVAEVEELLARVKSDCEDVKKRNIQIEKELEKKRLEKQMLTFEQHLGDVKSHQIEKQTRPLGEGVKRKKELTNAVTKNKKIRVVEHLKVMVEDNEVATQLHFPNGGVGGSAVRQEEKKGEVKISKRMSLVSENGLWYLKGTGSTADSIVNPDNVPVIP